jgi:hypothetical protein
MIEMPIFAKESARRRGAICWRLRRSPYWRRQPPGRGGWQFCFQGARYSGPSGNAGGHQSPGAACRGWRPRMRPIVAPPTAGLGANGGAKDGGAGANPIDTSISVQSGPTTQKSIKARRPQEHRHAPSRRRILAVVAKLPLPLQSPVLAQSGPAVIACAGPLLEH